MCMGHSCGYIRNMVQRIYERGIEWCPLFCWISQFSRKSFLFRAVYHRYTVNGWYSTRHIVIIESAITACCFFPMYSVCMLAYTWWMEIYNFFFCIRQNTGIWKGLIYFPVVFGRNARNQRRLFFIFRYYCCYHIYPHTYIYRGVQFSVPFSRMNKLIELKNKKN